MSLIQLQESVHAQTKMRVLVAGGRDFNDFLLVSVVLNSLHKKENISTVISGAAKGADKLGEYWASDNNVRVERYPALWHIHGKSAGHIRNQQMLDEGKPDLVIVFKGGRGSENMVERARKSGVKVRTPGWEGQTPCVA